MRKKNYGTERPSISAGQIPAMGETDSMTADGITLTDISDVTICLEVDDGGRTADLIRRNKNPCCYPDHGITVKISFTGESSGRLKDIFKDCHFRIG